MAAAPAVGRLRRSTYGSLHAERSLQADAQNGCILFEGTPKMLDCYWVGSLDFNFLANQRVFHYTHKKLKWDQQQPRMASVFLLVSQKNAPKKVPSKNDRPIFVLLVWGGRRSAAKENRRRHMLPAPHGVRGLGLRL